MSLTRLAGACSSAGFLAYTTRPCVSRSRTDSAPSASGRPLVLLVWARAGAATSQRAAPTTRTEMARTGSILLGGRIDDQRKTLADRAFEFLGGLEARRAPTRDVHGLSGARILALARFSTAHREGAEADERDRLPALERRAHRGQERAQRAVGARLGPSTGGGHRGHEVDSVHRWNGGGC